MSKNRFKVTEVVITKNPHMNGKLDIRFIRRNRDRYGGYRSKKYSLDTHSKISDSSRKRIEFLINESESIKRKYTDICILDDMSVGIWMYSRH